MRVVLDTNVLLQALGPNSPVRPVFEAVLAERIILVVSTEIVLEYEEILLRNPPQPVVARLMRFFRLAPNVHCHEPSFRFRLPLTDPDDQNFVDAYVAGNADYLVSNDRHFSRLSAAGFPAVRVVAAEALVTLLAA